jgi:hypothetical protein
MILYTAWKICYKRLPFDLFFDGNLIFIVDDVNNFAPNASAFGALKPGWNSKPRKISRWRSSVGRAADL